MNVLENNSKGSMCIIKRDRNNAIDAHSQCVVGLRESITQSANVGSLHFLFQI